ncbi:MAG: PilZ domain-containing protein [Clostridia bacterium]|nr:PilZ domain-containing protein [Clostridia bacterium]
MDEVTIYQMHEKLSNEYKEYLDDGITDKVRPGYRVTVEMEDGSQYASMIQNVDDEAEDIYINILTRGGIIHMPLKGTYVKLIINAGSCNYILSGPIIEYIKSDNLQMMHVARDGRIERLQRRRAFRLEKTVDVKLKIYSLYDLSDVEQATNILSADISETGIGFFSEKPLELNRFLDCRMSFDKISNMKRYRVVRCIKEDEHKYRIGLELMDNDEGYKDRIRRYIFAQQTK